MLKADLQQLLDQHISEINELRRQWEITTREKIKEQLTLATEKLNRDREQMELEKVDLQQLIQNL